VPIKYSPCIKCNCNTNSITLIIGGCTFGQAYDFTVRNSNGDVVATGNVPATTPLNPAGLPHFNITGIPPGQYTITSSKFNAPRWKPSITFFISPTFPSGFVLNVGWASAPGYVCYPGTSCKMPLSNRMLFTSNATSPFNGFRGGIAFFVGQGWVVPPVFDPPSNTFQPDKIFIVGSSGVGGFSVVQGFDFGGCDPFKVTFTQKSGGFGVPDSVLIITEATPDPTGSS
jgi:hypothetical protein